MLSGGRACQTLGTSAPASPLRAEGFRAARPFLTRKGNQNVDGGASRPATPVSVGSPAHAGPFCCKSASCACGRFCTWSACPPEAAQTHDGKTFRPDAPASGGRLRPRSAPGCNFISLAGGRSRALPARALALASVNRDGPRPGNWGFPSLSAPCAWGEGGRREANQAQRRVRMGKGQGRGQTARGQTARSKSKPASFLRGLCKYAIQLFTGVRLPHPGKIISIIGRSNLVWRPNG